MQLAAAAVWFSNPSILVIVTGVLHRCHSHITQVTHTMPPRSPQGQVACRAMVPTITGQKGASPPTGTGTGTSKGGCSLRLHCSYEMAVLGCQRTMQALQLTVSVVGCPCNSCATSPIASGYAGLTCAFSCRSDAKYRRPDGPDSGPHSGPDSGPNSGPYLGPYYEPYSCRSCAGKVTAVWCWEDSTGRLKDIAYLNSESVNSTATYLGCSGPSNVLPAIVPSKTLILKPEESIVRIETCDGKHG